MNEYDNKARVYSDTPDINELRDDFNRVRNELGWWITRSEENRNVRFNLWPNKSDDGRKHGPQAWPWDNASDLEVFHTDNLITSSVAMLKSSLKKSNLICAPVESSDVANANMVTEFMKWLVFSQMDELSRESEVLANNVLEKGLGILGVYWKREVQKNYRTLTIAKLMRDPDMGVALETGDPGIIAELMRNKDGSIVDDDLEGKILELLEGKANVRYTVNEVTCNRPYIKTYELGRDILIDANVMDLQSARSIYCLHYFTPEELKGKVHSDGWDEKFVDDAIEHYTGDAPSVRQSQPIVFPNRDHEQKQNYDGLIQVICSYRREVDENGVPVMSMTVFTERGEDELYATHTTITTSPAQYPFIAFPRECVTQRLFDSRGWPELLRGYEYGIKTERDARRDQASLSTVPPVEYVVGRAPASIGPGAKIPVRRRGEVGYMEIPRYSPASTEVEHSLLTQSYKVTGRPTDEADAVFANVLTQSMVDNWLNGWKQVLNQIWSLQKSYGDDKVWFRVTNNENGVEIYMDETGNKYDIELSWNTLNADEDKQLEKLEKVGTIMSQFDRNGQVDFGEFTRVFVESIDANLASKLIQPKETATQREEEETSADIAKIASGQVVNAPPNANAELRMSVIQNWLQGTEEIPGTDIQQKLQQDEGFQARLQTYMGQLQQAVQQQKNALIGKLGTPPGNMPPTSLG